MIPDTEVQFNPDTYVGNCDYSFALCKCEDQLALMAMLVHRYSQAAWSSRLGGRREGGREGWMGTGYFPPILYPPYPPFPSMSYRIKLLHEGASHTVPPWGAVLMSLTDWLTTRALGPAGSAPLWGQWPT